MKKYRFWYHYNKANNKMTVHYRKTCYIVNNIECLAPTQSKWNRIQPRLVIQGFAKEVIIENDKAYIR